MSGCSVIILSTIIILGLVSSASISGMPEAAGVNPEACNCVVFRLDDIQDYWILPVQLATMDVFLEKNQKVSLGVVMNFIGNDPIIIGKVNEGLSQGLFELDNHGWDHNDHTLMSLQDQENTLFSADNKMRSIFGTGSPVFIPPLNKFNEDTLTALGNINYKIISAETDLDPYPYFVADGSGSDIKDSFGIYHLPQTATFADHTNGEITYFPESQILSDIDNSIASYGYAVVTIHPQDFRAIQDGNPTSMPDQALLDDLKHLMDSIVARNYEMVTLAEVVGFQLPPIVDGIAPVVISPPDIAVVSSGSLTDIELGNPTVTDNIDPSPQVSNDAPAEGFPLGTTIVTWTATDASGNTAYATQFVTVVETADSQQPNVGVLSPTPEVVLSGSTSGITVNLDGLASDAEVLLGFQSNSITPTGSSNTKTVTLSGSSITTSGPVNGTIFARQTLTLGTSSTLIAGTPIKTVPAGSGLTLGDVTAFASPAAVPPGTTSSTKHILTLEIPFSTDGPVTGASIGAISTPLSLGTSTTSSISSTANSPIAIIQSGSAGGSGTKIVEVRTTTTSYKSAFEGESRDWSSWQYGLVLTPSMVDSEGSTTVVARATDFFNNQRWYTFPVTAIFSGSTDTSPPTILPPPPRTVQAAAPLTDVSLGFPTVSDNVTPTSQIAVTNDAPSSGFPVGMTTVTWTATDLAGNSASATQKVTVVDNIPPTIMAPDNVIVEPTGALTPVDLGEPVVNDKGDPSPVVTNDAPEEGFPEGETIVTWTATDASGNSAVDQQVVMVAVDEEAPTIIAPDDLTVEATGKYTTVQLGVPFVSDNFDPSPLVANDAPTAEGESIEFPIGTTIVNWTATDFAGNSATDTQVVTVRDTTAPTIIAPPDRKVLSRGTTTEVYLGEPKVSDSDANPLVTNDVTASPDLIVSLPVGTTIVNWTATDSAGNSSFASQKITVSEKVMILVFDDGYQDNFVTAKPILDQYGFKATFFIVTGWTGMGSDVMNWQDLDVLGKTGHDIEAHSVNHLNYDTLTLEEAIYEVRQSQVELVNRGYSARIYTSPMNSGEGNKTLISEIEKYYDLARLGVEPIMYLHCDGWDPSVTIQTDCRTYDEDGNVNFASRYQIKAWGHNSVDVLPDTDQIYQLFVNEVNLPTLNQNGQYLEIPIVYYHRIDDNIEESSTKVQLFADEMQYLHDNDFIVLTMNDLAYDETTNYLYIKERPLHDTTPPFIRAPPDIGVVKTGPLTQVPLGDPIIGDDRDLNSYITVYNNAPQNGFPAGTTTVTWTAKDFSGNTATATQRVVVVNNTDTEDPDISITSPVDGSTIGGTPRAVKVTVQGTAADSQSGISAVEVRTDPPSGLSYQLATPASSGDWSSWSVDLYFRADGAETVVARATDLFGNVNTTSVPITIDAASQTNVAPVAVNDAASTDEDTSVNIDVLANDTDADGDALAVASTTTPFNGSVAIEVNGTVTYTPNTNFNGSDSFDYIVSDGSLTDTGTVTITVNPVSDAPVALDDSAITDEDTSVTTPNLAANDTDPDGDTLSVVSTDAESANGGTVVNNGDGTATYTPPPSFAGTDTFDYLVSDGSLTDTGTVAVLVNAVNNAPISADDNAPAIVDTPVNINVLANDTDPDGDVLSVVSTTLPANGLVVIEPDSTITYTPNSGFAGTDTFDYTISDGTLTDTSTVTVTVSSSAVTHMSDTTSSFGLSVYAGRQAHVEFVTPSSQLFGDQIDQITLSLKRVGTPAGTVEIGVFNEDLSVKKLFGTLDAAILTTSYTPYTFTLSDASLYTIQVGDRIGIKYTGGDPSNLIAAMTDQDPADPFDGANSYHQYYTTQWVSFTNGDMYMVLVQTHGSGIDVTPPTVTTSPAGDTYPSPQTVTLTADEPSTIYYTLDGSEPTISSTVYTAPISIDSSLTLKFFGVDTAGNPSAVSTEIYTISIPAFPVTHMSDTTSSFGLSVYAGRQAHVEFVTPSSQLFGDQIDQITLSLKRVGSPTGTAEVGVFNEDLSVKKLFGTLDVASLTTSYADLTFSLSGELYSIEAGDRIGIKYTGGDPSNLIAAMTDQDPADPFDDANSYRQYYTTSWVSFTANDMYMVLVQTHE